MLPDIAAEVFLFLTRRDLDKASAVSKWLDAMIARCCETYPLRPVRQVELYQHSHQNCFTAEVRVTTSSIIITRTYSSMDNAARFSGAVLRHSFVEQLQLFHTVRSMALSSVHWTTLIDGMRSGFVQSLHCRRVNLCALGDDALLVAVGCRGLQSLSVRESVVPSGLVTDALLRVSVASGLLQLQFSENKSHAPHAFSDDALLDFFFAAGATAKGQERHLMLEGTGITSTFVSKFFQRLQSSPIRPLGKLEYRNIVKQRGLAAYAHYRAPAMHNTVVHHFPLTDDNNEAYAVGFYGRSSWMHIWFRLVSRSF